MIGHWGRIRTEQNDLKFNPCPMGYCCPFDWRESNENECTYDYCSNNRSGSSIPTFLYHINVFQEFYVELVRRVMLKLFSMVLRTVF